MQRHNILKNPYRAGLGLVISLMCTSVALAEVVHDVDLPADLKARYDELAAELRCPKCLNINIADSNAPIAADLRALVQQQLREGKTDREILDYIADRYGNFALYDPPLSPVTLALFLLPAILVLIAIYLLMHMRSRTANIEFSDSEHQTLESIKNRNTS